MNVFLKQLLFAKEYFIATLQYADQEYTLSRIKDSRGVKVIVRAANTATTVYPAIIVNYNEGCWVSAAGVEPVTLLNQASC